MPTPPSSSPVPDVRSAEARDALQSRLARLHAETMRRGVSYYRQQRVRRVHAMGPDVVKAVVKGSFDYDVTLALADGDWLFECTCPVGSDCKHAAAAGLAWVALLENTPSSAADLTASPVRDLSAPADSPAWRGSAGSRNGPGQVEFTPPPSSFASAFQDKWSDLLAQKLGRPLTDSERAVLRQLADLFHDTAPDFHRLGLDTLNRFGFGRASPPRAPSWGPVFLDWFNGTRPPGDPWELWQYLAYSLEIQGQPIAEMFRPMTDTAAIRTRLDGQAARRELATWRQAMTKAGALSGNRREPICVAAVRARFTPDGALYLEVRPTPAKPWSRPNSPTAHALARLRPGDTVGLPPADAALALVVALAERQDWTARPLRYPLPGDIVSAILNSPAAREAVVFDDGRPVAFEPEPLVADAIVSPQGHERLQIRLARPDGTEAKAARQLCDGPPPLYWLDGRIWQGPPPLPDVPLPFAALADPEIGPALRQLGVRLPPSLERRRRVVKLEPLLRISIVRYGRDFGPVFHVQLLAQAKEPRLVQEWRAPGRWEWTDDGAPPTRGPDDPILEPDRTTANAVADRLRELRMIWYEAEAVWSRGLGHAFPEEITAWRDSLPPDVRVEATPELAGLFGPPLRATVDFSAIAVDGGHDWFDVRVALRVEDTTLTPEEVGLLLKARGKWVLLPKRGWHRLAVDPAAATGEAAQALDRLGLTAADVTVSGAPAVHRMHALQLATEADAFAARDQTLADVLRERVAKLRASPMPPLPAGLKAVLRPYQTEGFHFLAHLSKQGFGGVLADDMGLGKTVQTLAWLLHLASGAKRRRKLRVLVVCPKSVTHGWLAETARFAPALDAVAFEPGLAEHPVERIKATLLVANYTQLRRHAGWFQSTEWDAAILDEAQFIKNPTSQIATAARALRTTHRLALTGTPVENRLTDLWSLFAFAQPGLLGPAAGFRRHYDDKDPAALARLHRRVRHFMLRRTKAQAAPDLPPRTEDDLTIDLEPAQRKLYDAELKRARQQLLGIDSDRALDAVRFNVLASLLRLRQICCHPALVDPAHAQLPSAKLDALVERLEELRDEGHQVLVFSQFVEMLELIRGRLASAGVGHLMLTGATEDRAGLVAKFQGDRKHTAFLLSLKAAGFGLNLTAASYAVLFDPWWNPAVEAQAIDRTHRIGQTRPVIAYRLLARDTIEEKIRSLQQEKAALAAAVVQEESLARVLDLESLRRILG
ncbi:MAG TPA: DEAD/DEAH box helicase [Opitutaceae bacterium]|nr:DEAD/DEAH box helicase [Opitutaceae bacterium]